MFSFPSNLSLYISNIAFFQKVLKIYLLQSWDNQLYQMRSNVTLLDGWHLGKSSGVYVEVQSNYCTNSTKITLSFIVFLYHSYISLCRLMYCTHIQYKDTRQKIMWRKASNRIQLQQQQNSRRLMKMVICSTTTAPTTTIDAST